MLRNRIKSIFQTYEVPSSFTFDDKNGCEKEDKRIISQKEDVDFNINLNCNNADDNFFANEYLGFVKKKNECICEKNMEMFEEDTKPFHMYTCCHYYHVNNNSQDLGKEYLLVENYTSVIYENCEDKINILLCNNVLPEGTIEVQIKGKESFLIPCKYSKNVLSFFSPQLEVGVYQLTFFINKQLIYSKLLKNNYELKTVSKSLPLHVIEISDFASSSLNRLSDSPNKKTLHELNKTNNVNTNKELLKIYNNIYKAYGKNENARNNKIMIGHNYKLHNSNEIDFYSFLKCYKDEFVDHTFSKNSKNKNTADNRKRNIINNTNNINFVSPLNLEHNVDQNRIPIMYKKLLYDNCLYENKKIIMQFHSTIFEFEPFKVLSVHIFTKSELKDGYAIFAFNLIPLAKDYKEEDTNNIYVDTLYIPLENQCDEKNRQVYKATDNKCEDGSENKNNAKEKVVKNYMSSLYMFTSDETNCADIRLWKHQKTVTCRKNYRAQNFYIKKEDCCTSIQAPVPPELISNKNIFRKYSEGIKISDNVSIFFESWNDEVMPVKAFLNLFHNDFPLQKMQHICSLIKNVNNDYFLFDESFEKKKNATNKISGHDEQKKTDGNKVENKETGNDILDHLLNAFVSFVLVIDGKIYNSVVPINKLLLIFIINLWMYFVPLRKPTI